MFEILDNIKTLETTDLIQLRDTINEMINILIDQELKAEYLPEWEVSYA